LDFGVQLHPQFGGTISDEVITNFQLSSAALCEKLGFDSVWVNEHHVAGDVYYPPLTLLSAVAAKTRRVRLGAYVVTPFYRPLELAEQTATIDQISRGRVILGPVLGYRKEEFEAYGVPFSERAPRTEEVVKLTKMLWTQPSVTYKGKYFALNNVASSPKPFQKPYPPIWIGATHDKAIRRATRLGDGWVAHLALTPLQVVARQVDLYKKTLKSVGKDVERATVASMVYLSIDGDGTVARRRAETHMAGSIGVYLKWGAEAEPPKIWTDERYVIGNPDECIKRVEAIAKAGVNHSILRVGYRGMTPAEITETIKLFGEKVLPHFKRRKPRG